MVSVKRWGPPVAEQDAVRLAAELYGVAGEARLLPGEHDRNFYLKTAAGEELVLKVSHAGEDRDVLDMQVRALAHLAELAPDLTLPRVRPTRAGELIGTVDDPDGATLFARLLTYMPGKLLANVRPHSPDLLHSLGNLLGTLDAALLDFAYPAVGRELKWDPLRAGWTRDYLHYIVQPERRALVEGLLIRFETETLPALTGLRHSVIYGDANDHNVVVAGTGTEERRVVAVIDFGDLMRTATVCDVAIACAYAMMGNPDPLAAAAHVVAGYHTALPLEEAELAVLY
ncbi:MAG TPA: phosphotransferase, partial [Ktedonobacterales bacterium]|nr:phosphotransferase [Ktedonobacterales bacterium]